jgi:hypothetical protein
MLEDVGTPLRGFAHPTLADPTRHFLRFLFGARTPKL